MASVDKNNPRPADILETVVPVKPTEQGSRCGRGRGKGRGGKGRGRGRGKGKKTYDEEEQEEEEHDDNNEDGDDAGEAEEGGAGKRKTAKTKTPKAKAKAAVKEKKTRKPKSKSAAKPAKESSKAAPKKHPRTQANRDGVDAGDDCPTTLKKKKATEVAVSEPKGGPHQAHPPRQENRRCWDNKSCWAIQQGWKAIFEQWQTKNSQEESQGPWWENKAPSKKEPKDPTSHKQRLSRKSSAYHKAKKAALKEGKTEEEANALAKKVF